jgi:UDP-glucose 4-epimerase
MTQTILVTGATGAVGPRVVHALDQAGLRIRSFSVDTPTLGMFPQNVEVLIGDVTDQAAVQSAMQGVDAVVHMAALLHIVNPPPELREKYERVNIGGTAMVVEVAIKAGVKRVVLFSTIAVYGPSDGRVLNEISPTHPDTFYAQTKCAAEQIVLNARGADGQPLGTVLRLGAVYGSRIKGNYERLTRALAGNLGGNKGTRSRSFDCSSGSQLETFAQLHETNNFVIPCKRSATRNPVLSRASWIPAFAGMTNRGVVQSSQYIPSDIY